MRPSLQARAFAALLGAIPDRVIAHTLTNPPRRHFPAFVPDSLTGEYDVKVTYFEPGRVATATPRASASGRHVFYLHGGAYTIGPMHWETVRPLLEQGWTVSMVDYPLAPENTVETTIAMVLAAWKTVTETASAPVDIMGDSAGGGLSLVLLQQIRDLDLTHSGRAVLFSPWVDLVMSDPVTIAADRHDPLLSLRGLRGAAAMYSDGRDLADPLLSPINGGLDDLGSIQVWVGTREMFRAQCCKMADLASRAAGTELDLQIGEGMIHNWAMLPTPEGRATVADAVRFLS